MLCLPTEIKLDILKFLNYKQLCSIKQTNLYFYDFINKYEGELAKEILYGIYIDDIKNVYPDKIIKLNVNNLNFALFDKQHEEINEQIEEKWSSGLPIPLYLPDQDLGGSNIVTWLSTAGISKYFVRSQFSEFHRVILELPTIITNKNQMKIVYYYLDRLFKCSFEYGIFDRFIFNPKLIQLLFGKISKQFYLIQSFLMFSKAYNSKDFFNFAMNHTISLLYRVQFYQLYRENNIKEYVDILQKVLMNGDKFNNVVIVCGNGMPKLSDLVINHIETLKDCSKMADKIVLNNTNINIITTLNEKAELIEKARDYMSKSIYKLSSKYNPKIKFSISIFGGGLLNKEIEIKRI
ncbi:unnamed protein product [Meloidogyne enterolobii]|uniref:Uncharacterized protein n=2 Tax=Meloidogyne enterolobii TaxID=390850 RepID=A0ACB0YGW7_MELEN|nr:unnamed protein product [Meloidogyne enterolobii]